MTLGEMKASVEAWSGETLNPSKLADAINDGIQSLWLSLLTAQLSFAFGGPVSLSLASGTERQTLTSIADPAAAPVPAAAAGGQNPNARTVYCAFTLATESGSETNLSPAASIALAANQLAQVPAPAFAAGALGWNCYMGSSVAALARQNPVPLPFAQAFTEPVTGEVDAPGAPAPPTSNGTADNVFYIQHMEVLQQDGSYKAWNQADIDTLMFRRYAATIASSQAYQPYVFDLVNQQTIEIRPPLGAALTPRYFYVAKPRRLRFDGAEIPFQTLAAEPFLRYNALKLITLSLYELDASEQWAQAAEQERQTLLAAVNQTNRPKQLDVMPYLY